MRYGGLPEPYKGLPVFLGENFPENIWEKLALYEGERGNYMYDVYICERDEYLYGVVFL